MKNLRFRLKSSVLSPILLTFLSVFAQASNAFSETFTSEAQRISLSYPSSLSPLINTEPGVLLTLKAKNGPFPTFNIIVQPGSYKDQDMTLSEKARGVLNSYRLVGITDAKILNSEEGKANSLAYFSLEMAYSMEGQAFISHVSIFSLPSRHFILTYVDQSSDYPGHKPEAISIRSSFTSSEGAGSMPIDGAPPYKATPYIVLLGLLIFGCGGLVFWRRRTS